MFSNPFSRRNRPTSSGAAFTLVELIISIGMVLILMAGVVKVFKYATDAVSAGLAVSDIVRVQRSLSTLIPADAQGLSINPTKCPAILLDSQQNTPPATFTVGTSNKFDTTSANTSGTVLGPCFLNKTAEATNYANLNLSDTQYRQDSFSFFSKSTSTPFVRQTGNDGTFVSPITSNWAWIWYGHLWLPTNATTGTSAQPSFMIDANNPSYPGLGTSSSNPNNFYASQWTLGRVAILLAERNSAGYMISGYWPGTTPSPRYQGSISDGFGFLSPLAYGSNTVNGGSTSYLDNPTSNTSTIEGSSSKFYTIQQSRYDLATLKSSSNADPFLDYFANPLAGAYLKTATYGHWYLPVVAMGTTPTSLLLSQLNYRFQANPFPFRPLTGSDVNVGDFSGGSAKAAQTVPILAPGCVRFYVEYAGDFINQNPNGTVNTTNTGWNVAVATAANPYQPDGIDFYIDQNGIRHIRWYGLPRSVVGSTTIDTNVAGKTVSGVEVETADVLPLAYYCANPPSVSNPVPATFERSFFGPFTIPPPFPFNHYICAWDATTGSIRPTMFRITVELIDTNGRLSSPRVVQYIVPVAQQ